MLPTIVYMAATKWLGLLPQLTHLLLRLPVGTRVVVTTHPLVCVQSITLTEQRPQEKELIEVWGRELDYLHGKELVRVYEIRPCP